MKSNETVDGLGTPTSPKLVGVLAIGLGLATGGYAMGVTEMATHVAQVSIQATAMMADGASVNSEPQAAAGHEPLASGSPQIGEPRHFLANPRECALDQGITEACTFN